MRVEDLQAIRIKLASPEDILNWSHGEVTKSETINYRTQKSEKDGLFCEKIFGPEKDYECYCGKYKRIRYKGVVCDRCGVEVTKSQVRRERMGHIKLANSCSHIWFLRGVPSRMGLVLDIPMQQLERVIYFTAYIITRVSEEAKKKILEKIEKEYKVKVKGLKIKKPVSSKVKGMGKKTEDLTSKRNGPRNLNLKTKLQELKTARDRAREEVLLIKPLKVLSEMEHQDLSLKYGEVFEAGTGSETLRKIFENINLKKEIEKLKKVLEETKTPETKRKILIRLRFFKGMEEKGISPEWMFLTVLPVLPPDLRPMVQLDGGRYASSDLNDLYRRVINRNNRLKYLLEIGAPEVIVRNEKRMLQEAVDSLIDNPMRKRVTTQATTGGKRPLKSLADMLKGKQGRFRQNLLGKRVDYSGRSVIVVGPELKLHECGIPKKMALELFKPFIIRKLLEKELAFNVRAATKLIEEEQEVVWQSLEEVVKDKLVLLNRAPTLHRLGIQSFEPRLIEGQAIKLHPLFCKAYNADFDGDQMAVYLPLSEEAQEESRKIMSSSLNLLKPATGLPVVTLYQDIGFGCYWLTKFKQDKSPSRAAAKGFEENSVLFSRLTFLSSGSAEEEDLSSSTSRAKRGGRRDEVSSPSEKFFGNFEEALLAYEHGQIDLRAKIKIRMTTNFLETSVGRIIFNQILPEGFPFQNTTIKTKDLERIVSGIIKDYPLEKVEKTLDKIKDLGFEYSTLSGVSFGMDDLIIPTQKPKIIEEAEKEIEKIESYFKDGFLTKEEKKDRTIEVWQRTKSEIEKLVPQTLSGDSSVLSIIEAGARGSLTQLTQMTGMKGLVINPMSQTIELPVKNSYKEGLSVLEYFISTHGARKGVADTALKTSTAGYLTRRLVDVSHEVMVSEESCGDKQGIEIFKKEAEEIGQNFLQKIIGRVILDEIRGIIKKGEIIDLEKGEEIIKKGTEKVRVRSPLTCKTIRGICRKCYGWDLGSNQMVKLGTAVGVLAAQSIGEPGTQLTMKTFHIGGVAGGVDITSGLPRVQEIFELRIPKGKAEISKEDGKVLEVLQEGIIKIKNKTLKSEIIEYKTPINFSIWVKQGENIEKGQQLCEGSLDLKELFKLTNKEKTQNYIIKEIQKIYVSQGVAIHDKHLEIIARQMFSRIKIKNPGDSNFISGEILEKSKFKEINNVLKKENKKIAVGIPLLLGITQVALTTDSFLSAASFQETSRVLIKAALEGKEDKLLGMKENVIIGRLIPAGTGFRK